MATSKSTSSGSSDDLTPVGEAVQKVEDEAVEKGYRGVGIDPTPNENYTVEGVTSGKPTPETDPEQAAKVGSGKYR